MKQVNLQILVKLIIGFYFWKSGCTDQHIKLTVIVNSTESFSISLSYT